MAETATQKTRRHITSITVSDDGATPLSYPIPVHGELTYTPGGYTEVETYTSDGDFSGLSPIKGKEQMTTGSIECTQCGLGGSDGADPVLKDLIDELAGYGTIGDTVGSDPAGAVNIIKSYDLTVVSTDDTGSETLVFENVTFQGSSYTTNLDDTNKITLQFKCRGQPSVSFA